MSSLGYSVYNFIFVAPLLLGIFLLVYKNSGLYHYAKNVIIMLDFVYIIGLIFIAATPLPWKISIVLVAAIGALASFTLIKFTFNSGR